MKCEFKDCQQPAYREYLSRWLCYKHYLIATAGIEFKARERK